MVSATDPFTSPPDTLSSLISQSQSGGYHKSTPILNMFNGMIHHLLDFIGYKTGVDSIARRSLDTTGTVEAVMIPVLVALSGMFAGLTLGYVLLDTLKMGLDSQSCRYFSIDQTQLQVLSISGNAKQQEHARKIMPVRSVK